MLFQQQIPCREPLAKSCIQSKGEEDRQTDTYTVESSLGLAVEAAELVCRSDLPSERTRSNGHKQRHKKFHLNMRKSFFMLRVAEA